MRDALICEPLRTPVGRFGGMFRDVPVTVAGHHRDQGRPRAHGPPPRPGRRRAARAGLRQRRGAGARPRRRARRRPARRGAGTADRPSLRLGPAGGDRGRHAGPDRRRRRRARRRRREHEPDRALLDRAALGRALGRRDARGPPRPRPGHRRRRELPGARRDDRDGREPAPRVLDPAPGAGRARPALPSARRRRPGERRLRRGDRPRRGPGPQDRHALDRPRRAPARRRLAREPGLAAPGDGAQGSRRPPSPPATPAARTTAPRSASSPTPSGPRSSA